MKTDDIQIISMHFVKDLWPAIKYKERPVSAQAAIRTRMYLGMLKTRSMLRDGTVPCRTARIFPTP
jgi:hypothetical protein